MSTSTNDNEREPGGSLVCRLSESLARDVCWTYSAESSLINGDDPGNAARESLERPSSSSAALADSETLRSDNCGRPLQPRLPERLGSGDRPKFVLVDSDLLALFGVCPQRACLCSGSVPTIHESVTVYQRGGLR